MALEEFFEEGNKLGVFGSFVYSPESASDLDFTLFTTNGQEHFYGPEYSDEITEFLESQYGKINLGLDFTGRRDTIQNTPYDLSNLPENDVRLDGHLLTGVFFPDNDFLNKHYEEGFGENFLVEAWLRYSKYVEGFKSQGARLDKRHKDLALLLRSAQRLVNDGHTELEETIRDYRSELEILNNAYRNDNMDIWDYKQKTRAMVPNFVTDINSLLVSE